jgi:ribonuclease HI
VHGNPGPAGAGIVFSTEDGISIRRGYRFLGETTSNVAEYRALIIGLEQALEQGYRRVRWQSHSELVVKQVRGEYRVRSPQLQEPHGAAMALLEQLEWWSAEYVPAHLTKDANRLARLAVNRGTPSEQEAEGDRR